MPCGVCARQRLARVERAWVERHRRLCLRHSIVDLAATQQPADSYVVADGGEPVHVKGTVELENLSGDHMGRLHRGKLLVGIEVVRPPERSSRFFRADEYRSLDLFRNRLLL